MTTTQYPVSDMSAIREEAEIARGALLRRDSAELHLELYANDHANFKPPLQAVRIDLLKGILADSAIEYSRGVGEAFEANATPSAAPYPDAEPLPVGKPTLSVRKHQAIQTHSLQCQHGVKAAND
jgi:hypothetical protein